MNKFLRIAKYVLLMIFFGVLLYTCIRFKDIPLFIIGMIVILTGLNLAQGIDNLENTTEKAQKLVDKYKKKEAI